jgi:hypothetical protein
MRRHAIIQRVLDLPNRDQYPRQTATSIETAKQRLAFANSVCVLGLDNIRVECNHTIITTRAKLGKAAFAVASLNWLR